VSWLARKAFYPARIPFTFIHIDTGHNFRKRWSSATGG
jgi:sulfate adenylyltransferase subunit 2